MEEVMYLIVRTDLKMSKGKIAAQCGHAVEFLTYLNFKKYKKFRFAYGKIALQVKTETELEAIQNYCRENNIIHHQVIDAGRTQIPANSKTVLGIGPIPKDLVPEIISNLKLL